ncbi:MAG: helicase-related protein, partial [Planctomycetota bacterium]|nr:helicase-related protein [Planctomycetota bacterium]
ADAPATEDAAATAAAAPARGRRANAAALRTSEDFRREAEKLAAATLVNRLVMLRLLEAPGPDGTPPMRSPAVVTGGWESRGYRDFRELAASIVRGDATEGSAFLLRLVYADLAMELPGLYGDADHSAVSREERQLAEERFHHGTDACIVCTSTLELGIDVGDLDRVLQAEAPTTVGSFLQRMGRTGRRAGQAANTTFLCETAEGLLQAVALVELAKSGWVESVEVSDRCWPVLIHQLLALSLADAGVTAEDAWGHLSRVRDFAGIGREEYERLIAWLLENDWFRMASGRLVLGPEAERRFGRRNFMELYAVFSSPQSYAVETGGGQALGTLNQDFVDRLVDGVSTFLLSGQAWLVRMIRHDERRVIVEPAPRGRRRTWGGFLPQFLGFGLCQRIRHLLAGEEPYTYLDEPAAAVLAEQREILGPVLRGNRGDLEIIEGEYRWWTFAGGRINSTLRHALTAGAGDWRVTTDNFTVRMQGDALNGEAFEAALARLRQEDL